MIGQATHDRFAAMSVACPNCGSEAVGEYCSACGQSQRSMDRSAWHLLRESLEDLLSVEGRAFRTLRPLLLRPGALTADYLAGRRAHYTPPFRLYLVASAAFFLGFLLTRSIDQSYYGLAGGDANAYANAMARTLVLLLPVFALVLKLLYVSARRPLTHHIVLTLHAGAAALLWFLLLTLLAAALKAWWGHHTAAPAWLPDFAFWLYLPGAALYLGYVAAALRRAYRSSWAGASLRVVLLAAVAVVVFLWVLPRVLVLLPGAG